MKQGKTKKIILGILILAVLVAGLLFAYTKFKPGKTEGTKTVTIQVVDDQKQQTDYTVESDAQTLREAMDNAEGLTYSGDESEYGIMITTVNGVVADYEKDGAYWAFYVNDEYCNYGIEEQPVNDQDVFKIEYTTAQ